VQEEQEARRVLLQEALGHLRRRRSKRRGAVADDAAMLLDLMAGYQRRLDELPVEWAESAPGLRDQNRRREMILDVLQVERDALIRMRDEDEIDDEVLRTLQRELDLEESRVHTGGPEHN